MSAPALPRPDRGLAALVAAYLTLATLYAVRVPLWEAPDAVWHYHFAAHLAAGNGLPTKADEGVTAPWRQQGSQPPLYYLLTAPLIAAVAPTDAATAIRYNPHAAVGIAGPGGNVNRMVHHAAEAWPWRGTVLAARLVSLASVAFGLVAVLATWAAARAVFPRQPAVALASAAVLAFNPELLFFSGAISNDIAVAAAGALVLWRAAVVLRDGATPRASAWLGVACGLALLTKLSGVWLLPAAGAAVAWAAWRGVGGPDGRDGRPDDRADGPPDDGDVGEGDGSGDDHRVRAGLRPAPSHPGVTPHAAAPAAPDAFGARLARAAAWCALPALAVAGWWYARNWLLFGDPSGLPLMLNVMTPRPVPPTWRELAVQLATVWRSYWAVFGWFNIPAPDRLYALFDGLTLAGLGGVAVLAARRRLPRAAAPGLALAAGTVVLIAAALVAWAQVRYPQGRLAFPAAAGLSLLIGAGWTAGLDERRGRLVALALAAALAVAGAWLLVRVVEPAYAPDPLRTAATPALVPASRTSGRHVFGGMLHAYAVSPGVPTPLFEAPPAGKDPFAGIVAPTRPGDRLTLDIRWRVVRRPDRDYSVFVHLRDESGLIVAQRDSYPQSGRAPTSDWRPADPPEALDRLYPDRHVLQIPATAPAPCTCRLVYGVYDAATGTRLTTQTGADEVTLGYVLLTPHTDARGIANPLDVPFGDDVVLQGYNLDRRAVPAGERLGLTLYWQTRRPLATDYKVSVQVRRGAAETWGQHDEPPADGQRPTTGWIPGETIVDTHPVLIYPEAPPDVYTLFVKMYDPADWQALPVDVRDYELALASIRVLPAEAAPAAPGAPPATDTPPALPEAAP